MRQRDQAEHREPGRMVRAMQVWCCGARRHGRTGQRQRGGPEKRGGRKSGLQSTEGVGRICGGIVGSDSKEVLGPRTLHTCSGWWSRFRTQELLGQSNAGDTCSASEQANGWEKHGEREKLAVCHWTGHHLSLGPSFGDCSVAPSLPWCLGQRWALALLMLSWFPTNE